MKLLLLVAVFITVLSLILISKRRYYKYFYGSIGGGGAAGAARAIDIAPGTAGSASWTFPLVMFTSILIAWGAEVAEFLVSQGMALAILAWLQVMPEFAVEAAISHDAALDPSKIHLITANFTGSNRLLVGLGWPLIFFTAIYFFRRVKRTEAEAVTDKIKERISKEKKKGRKEDDPYMVRLRDELEEAETAPLPDYDIKLEPEHSVEIIGLLIPTIYFFVIWIKGTLTLWDSVVLIVMYLAYLYILNLLPPEAPEKAENLHGVPRYMMKKSRKAQIAFVLIVFTVGGVTLFMIAEPFLHSMMAVAVLAGISSFWFIQWVAPFMSEFPEKLSAFYWAKTIIHAPMAMMNMISSKINQWTILVAMIPMVYCITLGHVAEIKFDASQEHEILLTIAQSLFAVSILMKMRITLLDASTLFILWFIQFVVPAIRLEITFIYFILFVAVLIYYRNELKAFHHFADTMRDCAERRRQGKECQRKKEKEREKFDRVRLQKGDAKKEEDKEEEKGEDENKEEDKGEEKENEGGEEGTKEDEAGEGDEDGTAEEMEGSEGTEGTEGPTEEAKEKPRKRRGRKGRGKATGKDGAEPGDDDGAQKDIETFLVD